jgi:hypothetical protein
MSGEKIDIVLEYILINGKEYYIDLSTDNVWTYENAQRNGEPSGTYIGGVLTLAGGGGAGDDSLPLMSPQGLNSPVGWDKCDPKCLCGEDAEPRVFCEQCELPICLACQSGRKGKGCALSHPPEYSGKGGCNPPSASGGGGAPRTPSAASGGGAPAPRTRSAASGGGAPRTPAPDSLTKAMRKLVLSPNAEEKRAESRKRHRDSRDSGDTPEGKRGKEFYQRKIFIF